MILIGFGLFNSSKSGIKIGSKTYQLEQVSTPEKLQLGLSNRNSLGSDSGMVFVFSRSQEQCIWMKDMNFTLDIIWLDIEGKILALEENVNPASYPRQYCHGLTKYVIELNAGEIKSANIVIDQSVNLNQP